MGMARTCRGILGEVGDGLEDPPGGSGRVRESSRRSGTGLMTFPVVRERVGGSWGGPEPVGGPSGRSGTDRGILEEIQDGSGDPRVGLGRVRGPLWRSGTGWGTLGEVRDGTGNLEEVGDGLGDSRGVP